MTTPGTRGNRDERSHALDNTDLRLFSAASPTLSDEQRERQFIIFSMLISLFERACLLLHEERMPRPLPPARLRT